ncbi:GPI-GlcNAc transferase complex, PIG-H component-domain-containing protein [Hypoxylon sp. FL1857]|nr:GPI-GlcNAc transferase complex, PIG-H component-domain-containing protein [Hypoxylon sp. FL1857]
MLTTAPYLRTRRPSPTTAEFIVSTLPPLTLPLRIALTAVYLLRLVLSLGVLLLLYSAWAQSPYASTTASTDSAALTSPLLTALDAAPIDSTGTGAHLASLGDNSSGTSDASPSLASLAYIQQTLDTLLQSRIGLLCSSVTASIPPWVLVPSSVFMLYILSLRIGAEERLLVLRGLGIQTSSSSSTIFGSLKTRFIPTDKIQDVFINEVFRGFEVRHVLVVIVEGEEHVVVVFPKLLPRPRILEKVWRGVRGCLYEYDGGPTGDGKL